MSVGMYWMYIYCTHRKLRTLKLPCSSGHFSTRLFLERVGGRDSLSSPPPAGQPSRLTHLDLDLDLDLSFSLSLRGLLKRGAGAFSVRAPNSAAPNGSSQPSCSQQAEKPSPDGFPRLQGGDSPLRASLAVGKRGLGSGGRLNFTAQESGIWPVLSFPGRGWGVPSLASHSLRALGKLVGTRGRGARIPSPLRRSLEGPKRDRAQSWGALGLPCPASLYKLLKDPLWICRADDLSWKEEIQEEGKGIRRDLRELNL